MTRQDRSEGPEPSRLSDPQMWDRMAAWWDQKQGEEGNRWHRLLIEPIFERVIGDVGGLRVLEIACGNGRLARRMARRGAKVTAVDASEGMILHARQREAEDPTGTEYHLADAACLGLLADGSFDLVVAGMALMDIADAEGALLETGQALRVGGKARGEHDSPLLRHWGGEFPLGGRALRLRDEGLQEGRTLQGTLRAQRRVAGRRA